MKQITLNIPDNKFKTFLEFLGTLEYVKVENEEEKAVEELQESLHDVALMQKGKLPKQSAQNFLNEL